MWRSPVAYPAGAGGSMFQMKYYVYILFSDSLKRYYTGHTENIIRRLMEHNNGKGNFTSKGIPWRLIHQVECKTKSEVVRLEARIKNRGIKRYLQDTHIL